MDEGCLTGTLIAFLERSNLDWGVAAVNRESCHWAEVGVLGKGWQARIGGG